MNWKKTVRQEAKLKKVAEKNKGLEILNSLKMDLMVTSLVYFCLNLSKIVIDNMFVDGDFIGCFQWPKAQR